MTHEFEAMDLSPLDPERDPEHWAWMVQTTRRRVAAVLGRRTLELDPFDVLSGWTRPVLAAAAVLVLLGAAGALIGGRPAAADLTDARRLARLTETTVLHGRPPSGAELLAAMRPAGLP